MYPVKTLKSLISISLINLPSIIKIYIIKGGFLDGIPGFIAGISAYVYGFLKYAFLWEMHNAGKNKDTGK